MANIEREPSEERLKVEALSLAKPKDQTEGARHNQDSHIEILDEGGETGLFGVADGVGGAVGGEIASREITEAVKSYAPKLEHIRKQRAEGNSRATLKIELVALRHAMEEANARFRKKRDALPERFHEMATTGTFVRVTKDQSGHRYALIGHTGDSRVYLLQPDGKLETLTLDAHPALEYVRRIEGEKYGEKIALRVQDILDEILDKGQLDVLLRMGKNGRRISPETGVTGDDIEYLESHLGGLSELYFNEPSRIVGIFGFEEEPHITTKMVEVPPGAKIVLCTDATFGLLKREIRAILRGRFDELPYQGVKEAVAIYGDTPAEALAFAARERGEELNGEHRNPRSKGNDDTTVVTIDVPAR